MCSIFGRIALGDEPVTVPPRLVYQAQLRGRDSWGISTRAGANLRVPSDNLSRLPEGGVTSPGWIIGNTRAEPTTEYVEYKTEADVQPFTAGALVVAHNGTIANDRALCEEYGVDADDMGTESKVDTARWARVAARTVTQPRDVLSLLGKTVGSYGIAVGHRDAGWAVLATNYKPIWTRLVDGSLEFTSVAPRLTHLPYWDTLEEGWQMLTPYSALIFTRGPSGTEVEHVSLRTHPAFTYSTQQSLRALVVCSGGLDSVTAATMVAQHMPVDLLHITYGARAQTREVEAVYAVAERMGWKVRYLDLTDVFRTIGHSRLTGSWEGAAAGEEGAEYAIEWVPARNTILLATALGVAEGHGYSHLVLGNNIEESGAYPDNEQEFIGRFNDMLPFAVADGKDVTIIEPVGTFTKREIVQVGLEVGAPLDLTWSCYDGGAMHCGDCGPCYMRRTAFRMLGVEDPLPYLTDADGLTGAQMAGA